MCASSDCLPRALRTPPKPNYIDIDLFFLRLDLAWNFFCNELMHSELQYCNGSGYSVFPTDTLSTPYQRLYDSYLPV